LKEADLHGESLQIFIQGATVPDVPFELLYDFSFIITSKAHIIHQISDYGLKRQVNPKNHPLKILFMACSPEGVTPVLNYEKEEDS
jgi:hypothetical protein